MNKSELYPNTFKDMNKEFQYLWNKYGRDDWNANNLGDYCANLEYMIMNYLDRNKELGPIKDTSLKSQTDEITAKIANYIDILDSFASGIIGDVEIPKEVLEKIKEDKLEDEEGKKPKEESEEVTEDNTITGIPFANRTDAGPSYDELLTYPNGALFDNDTMRNSYYGLYSLMGNYVNECVKMAEMYYRKVNE